MEEVRAIWNRHAMTMVSASAEGRVRPRCPCGGCGVASDLYVFDDLS